VRASNACLSILSFLMTSGAVDQAVEWYDLTHSFFATLLITVDSGHHSLPPSDRASRHRTAQQVSNFLSRPLVGLLPSRVACRDSQSNPVYRLNRCPDLKRR
jgi:hypothetical protein